MHRVLPEAGVVCRVRQQVAVGADRHAADRQKRLTLRQHVHVEHDLLGCGGVEAAILGRTSPGIHRVLAALDCACGVPPSAKAVGNRLVGLLDVREHLAVERRLQIFGAAHCLSRVGVLRLEIRDHLGRALVAHPAELVGQASSMQLQGLGITTCTWYGQAG